MNRLAFELANSGRWTDAIALAFTNESANPTSAEAAKARFSIEVSEKISAENVTSGLNYYLASRNQERQDVNDHTILDGIAWATYRQDKLGDALSIFRKNLELHKDEYIPNESLADALWFSDQKKAGAAVLAEWMDRNPQHEMGRRRLLNMRDQL